MDGPLRQRRRLAVHGERTIGGEGEQIDEELDKAKRRFVKALDLKPTDVFALKGYSTVLYAMSDWNNLLTVYTSTPQQPSATTTPSGLSVSFTFNGSPTAPSNAGDYTVVANITDPDHQGTTSATFTIAKAVTALTISGTAATYDGNSHAVSITSTPGGVTVTVTYDGSSAVPTNAGVYDIVATVDDPNRQGTASATLVIARATATTTVTCRATTATCNVSRNT